MQKRSKKMFASKFKKIVLGGLAPIKPPSPPPTGGSTPRPTTFLDYELVIWYHWLAFLNQVKKNRSHRNLQIKILLNEKR